MAQHIVQADHHIADNDTLNVFVYSVLNTTCISSCYSYFQCSRSDSGVTENLSLVVLAALQQYIKLFFYLGISVESILCNKIGH